MRASTLIGPLVLLWATSCAIGPAKDTSTGGLATVIDSTADTVIARVDGVVPENAVRTLVEEIRIAPSAEDTSLFTKVSHVAVDRAGRMWAFDESTASVFLLGPDGKLLRRISRKGSGPGEIQEASGIATLPDTGLAVWDLGNGRISFFDASGAFRTGWRLANPMPYQGPYVDRNGTLYLNRAVDERDRVIRALEQVVGELPGDALLRPNEQGDFADSLVVPRLAIEPVRYAARNRGIRATYAAPYAPAALWALHPDGYLVVGHGGKFEVTIPRRGAKPIVIRRGFVPVPVSTREQEEDRAWITYSLQKTDPSWSWSGPPLPQTKPPLLGLAIGRDGRIWAQVPAPSERIPDAELETPGADPKAPLRHYRTLVFFEVFGPDGRFVGKIKCPSRFTLIESDGENVWGTTQDENDLTAIVRYRIQPRLQ